MLKLIIGKKGSGKTKKLIDAVTCAADVSKGNVVCIEKAPQLTYSIPHTVRLIYANEFSFGSYEFFKGFISGLHAGNYDINEVFIDNLFKMVEDKSDEALCAFLAWLDEYGTKEGINFTLSVSMDEASASEGIKKYVI